MQVEPRRSLGNGITATRNAALDGCLTDSVIVGRAGVEMLIHFHAEGFEACAVACVVDCLRARSPSLAGAKSADEALNSPPLPE